MLSLSEEGSDSWIALRNFIGVWRCPSFSEDFNWVGVDYFYELCFSVLAVRGLHNFLWRIAVLFFPNSFLLSPPVMLLLSLPIRAMSC